VTDSSLLDTLPGVVDEYISSGNDGPDSTEGCGKLKADQWREAIDFDIPVSLMKMWSKPISNQGSHLDDRRDKVLRSTMLLAMALRWGTSHRTSTKHAAQYMKHMRAYLASLRDLFPDTDLRTSHHNALFIGEMLLRFGPVHGWWMFPFERVIGLLQQVNSNCKLGKFYKFYLKIANSPLTRRTRNHDAQIVLRGSQPSGVGAK